jgi:hypothetical protein
MNTRCPENYILFMFANPHKSRENLRYSDFYDKRREPGKVD